MLLQIYFKVMAALQDGMMALAHMAVEFHKRYYDLQVKGTGTDFDLVAGNQKYGCHSIILAAASSRLRREMQTIKQRGGRPEMRLNFPEGMMQELIRYLYTGTCTVDMDYLSEYFRAARYLEVHSLHDNICQQVESLGIPVIPEAAWDFGFR